MQGFNTASGIRPCNHSLISMRRTSRSFNTASGTYPRKCYAIYRPRRGTACRALDRYTAAQQSEQHLTTSVSTPIHTNIERQKPLSRIPRRPPSPCITQNDRRAWIARGHGTPCPYSARVNQWFPPGAKPQAVLACATNRTLRQCCPSRCFNTASGIRLCNHK